MCSHKDLPDSHRAGHGQLHEASTERHSVRSFLLIPGRWRCRSQISLIGWLKIDSLAILIIPSPEHETKPIKMVASYK